jgi:hypothetical protein
VAKPSTQELEVMALYQYVVLTRAVEGRTDEFARWYDDVHLADVVALPGVISAKRYRMVSVGAIGIEAPHWDSLAIYEIDADDPNPVLQSMVKAANTKAMLLSEAMSSVGVQFLVKEVSAKAKTKSTM